MRGSPPLAGETRTKFRKDSSHQPCEVHQPWREKHVLSSDRIHHTSKDEVQHPWREKRVPNFARIRHTRLDEVRHPWREQHVLISARIPHIRHNEVHHPWREKHVLNSARLRHIDSDNTADSLQSFPPSNRWIGVQKSDPQMRLGDRQSWW